MNTAERGILLGLSLALLITSLADNLIAGALLGFALGIVIGVVSREPLEEGVCANGIAMILSFVFLGLTYESSLADTFGGPLVILLTIGYIFVGIIGGFVGYYIRRGVWGIAERK